MDGKLRLAAAIVCEMSMQGCSWCSGKLMDLFPWEPGGEGTQERTVRFPKRITGAAGTAAQRGNSQEKVTVLSFCWHCRLRWGMEYSISASGNTGEGHFMKSMSLYTGYLLQNASFLETGQSMKNIRHPIFSCLIWIHIRIYASAKRLQ